MALRRVEEPSHLRVKIREEGTPRRHVDLIDDHCHASCQMDFPLAISRLFFFYLDLLRVPA